MLTERYTNCYGHRPIASKRIRWPQKRRIPKAVKVSDVQILHARPHHVCIQHLFTIRFATRLLTSSMFAPGVPQVLRDFHSADKLLGSFAVSVYVLGYATGPLPVAPCPEASGLFPHLSYWKFPFIVFMRSEREPKHAHWIPLPPRCCQMIPNYNWWWNYCRSICSEAKRRTLHLRLSYPTTYSGLCSSSEQVSSGAA